jgi:hypothetical protein
MSPKPNICPLCDKHHCPMVPGSVKSTDSTLPVFGCTVDKCPRHYDVSVGYFDVISGKTFGDKYGKRPCKKDGMALYLESRDDQKQEENWCCPEAKCNRRVLKSTRLPEFLLIS